MVIEILNAAKTAINILENAGFEAYIVGGCVRDSVLNKSPKDWDITTNALPNEMLNAFKDYRVIETGIKHGTITVIIKNYSLEITTYRIDGTYSDNRRPDSVEFTENIKEDLCRRDFTINAMAYNPKLGFKDFFSGKEDIENKIIRCVGNPDTRFNEDALRILRALRFASVLSFDIEENTRKSIFLNKGLLKNIAKERIISEFNKILMGESAKKILTEYCEVIEVFIPEIKDMVGFKQNNKHHHLDVWQHTLETINNAEFDATIRLTMFFHDIAKPMTYTEDSNGVGHFYGHPKYSCEIAKKILKRLKYDNKTVETVYLLISYHDYRVKPEKKSIKKLLSKIGEDNFRSLMKVQEADILGQNPLFAYEKLETLKLVNTLFNEIIEENMCFSIKDLNINGNDLIGLGIPKGKVLGEILNNLLEMVMDEKISNDNNILKIEALNFLKSR